MSASAHGVERVRQRLDRVLRRPCELGDAAVRVDDGAPA